MYYYNNINAQASIDRLDAQIRELENMRNQLQRTLPQQGMSVAENLQKQIDDLKGRLDKYEQYINATNTRENKYDEPPRVSNATECDEK